MATEEQSAFEENKAIFVPAAAAQEARVDLDVFLNFAVHRGPEWAEGYLAALEGIYPFLDIAAYGDPHADTGFHSDRKCRHAMFDIVGNLKNFLEGVKAHRAGSTLEGSIPEVSKAQSPKMP